MNKRLMMFLLLGVISLAPTWAQITVDIRNQSIRNAFRFIEQRSNYKFFYPSDLKGLERVVSVKVEDGTIDALMSQLLTGTALDYKRGQDNVIVISEKDSKALQMKKITGVITDNKGETIIGANVMIKGAGKGTITDIDGKFTIEAPEIGTLEVSYIGFQRQEVSLKGKNYFKIVMTEGSRELDELVVVGYGALRKSDITGSVTKLVAKDTEEKGYTSVEQMLQGRTSGVQITQNSGSLGGGITFNIRGATSLTGDNQPLIVVDGYPIEAGEVSSSLGSIDNNIQSGTNVLASLNPNDIESIEILKDASSTAIYGSRGANGVVLVTTKRGKEGKDRIEYSFRSELSQINRFIDVLRPEEYMMYMNESKKDYSDGRINNNSYNVNTKYKNVNGYWQDLVYQTGFSQSHQLNLSGGDKKLKYALSGNYLNQNGIIKNSNFQRGTVRLNLDREFNTRFNMGVNFNGALSLNKSPMQSAAGTVGGSVVVSALRTSPLYEYEDDDFSTLPQDNPVSMVQLMDDVNQMFQIGGTMFANYKILSPLQLRARVGINVIDNNRNYYMPRGTYTGNIRRGYAYEANSRNINYATELMLHFNKTIANKHRINAVGGGTWQSSHNKQVGQGVSGFPNDDFSYNKYEAALQVYKPINKINESSLASFLGRFNYSYDNRYLFTATARADGSTRLASGYKWAIFPSLALGWNMHNESFFKEQQVVSELKLRLSYGESGSQSIPNGSSISQYDVMGNAVVDQKIVNAYFQSVMANEKLTWERTSQYNAGVDLGFLENRFKLTVEAYYKLTRGLLINLPLPPSTGFDVFPTNAGDIENKGIEFDLSAQIFKGVFNWTTSGNISFNRNRILKFDGNMTQIIGEAFGAIGGAGHISKVGYPIGSFYGYVFDGIYQTQNEIDNSPRDPQNPRPGDVKFRDISGPNGVPDGQISTYDMTIVGNPYPDFIFGWNNDLSWKNLSLSFLIQGSMGQDLINAVRFQMDGLSSKSENNVRREAYENRWYGPGTSNTYPAPRSQIDPFFGRFSNFIVEDASFIRLKNVTAAYNFTMKKSFWIKNIKLFLSANNLLTWTMYKGYDPEVNSNARNAQTPGIDSGSIPQFKSYSAGLSVVF